MVYIIVPVFYRLEETRVFLNSIKSEYEFKIVIVDDSCFHQIEKLVSNYSNVDYILGSGRLYWGGAINMGLCYIKSKYELTSADYVVFANNDIIVPSDIIKLLVDNISGGGICPVSLDESGIVIRSGGKLISRVGLIIQNKLVGKKFSDLKDLKNSHLEIDILTCRFMMFKYSTLQGNDFIRTEYFQHYGGDVDLGLRLAKFGQKCHLFTQGYIIVNSESTGLNVGRIKSVRDFGKSIFSMRSSNGIIMLASLTFVNFGLLLGIVNLVYYFVKLPFQNLYYAIRR